MWSCSPGGAGSLALASSLLWLKLRALPGFFGPKMAGGPLPLLPLLLPEEWLALISPVTKHLGLSQRSELRLWGHSPPSLIKQFSPRVGGCCIPNCPHEQCFLRVPVLCLSTGWTVQIVSALPALEWGLGLALNKTPPCLPICRSCWLPSLKAVAGPPGGIPQRLLETAFQGWGWGLI